MKVKKILLVGAVISGLSLVTAAGVSAKAVISRPTSFQSNGDLISGWYWLRATNHTATWTFDATGLQAARSSSVNLNLDALVTNGVNGGSGYSTVVRLTVNNGTRTRTTSMLLSNPFRPIDPANSGGIGYQAYGHVYMSSSVWRGAKTITVTVGFPSMRGYHAAVNQDALTIGYSIAG